MSVTNCPFDGDFCQKKQLRFDSWQKVIIQNDGMVFQINPNMFADCPIETESDRKQICERYQRYLFVVRNAKVNAK